MKSLSQFFLMSIIILLFSNKIFSQAWYSQSFSSFEYPHSVRNLGLGMNGVVSSSSIDALTYNPANLLFTKNPTVSFYHQGYQLVLSGIPMNDYSVYYNAGDIGSFGIDYSDWDLGKMGYTTPDSPIPVRIEESYERSISFGYAKSINANAGIGASFRYGFASTAGINYNSFLFSIGAFDRFNFLNRNWHAGISVMNLGPAVEYKVPNLTTFYESPPSFLSLGLSTKLIETKYISLPVSISIAKPFDKRDDNGEGQSSFKTLFSDWGDFPNDASISPGFALEWNTLNLGDGFYFSQNIYVGNYSDGVKSGLVNYYTHGIEMSLSYNELKLTAGYSGVWHNPRAHNYLQWQLPYETFQFSLSVNPDMVSRNSNEISQDKLSDNSIKPKNIILTFGAGQLFRVGTAKSISFRGYDIKQKNNIEYSIESAFYLNKRSALVMLFSYNSLPVDVYHLDFNFNSMKMETITLISALRYHPLENLKNFFVQGGFGIARLYRAVNLIIGISSVVPLYPEYYYTTELNAAVGYNIELQNNIVLVPVVSYDLLLQDAWENHGRISGNNQLNLGLRLGYKF